MGMQKMITTTQFSVDIYLIQQWKLLSACPDMPANTLINKLNQAFVPAKKSTSHQEYADPTF